MTKTTLPEKAATTATTETATTTPDLLKTDSTLDVLQSAMRLTIDQDSVKLQDGEEEDGKKRKPRFSMIVTSGRPFSHWLFGTLAINLSGISFDRNQVPALADHDVSRRVGYTTKVSVADKGLHAEGIMLSNPHAREILDDSEEGFRFQASCYLQATKVLELEEGVEHEVNGHKMTGPGYVFEECHMREVTFTVLGADPNTSAEARFSDGAERVTAQLSVKGKTMTNTQPTEPQPAPAPKVDEAALRTEAQQAERDRVSKIMQGAAPNQIELATKLVEDGTELSDALLQLNKDLREKQTAQLGAGAGGAPPTDAQPLAEPEPEPQPKPDDASAKLSAMKEGDEKWRAEYEASEKLQAEFDNANIYCAFRRNEGKTRAYGSEAALRAAQEEN